MLAANRCWSTIDGSCLRIYRGWIALRELGLHVEYCFCRFHIVGIRVPSFALTCMTSTAHQGRRITNWKVIKREPFSCIPILHDTFAVWNFHTGKCYRTFCHGTTVRSVKVVNLSCISFSSRHFRLLGMSRLQEHISLPGTTVGKFDSGR